MRVPHAPEGAEQGDPLGPAPSPRPGLLLLIEDTQLGDTAAPLDRYGVPRVEPGLVTGAGGSHITWCVLW